MNKFLIIALMSLPFWALIGWLGWVLVLAFRDQQRERLSPTTFNPNRFYVSWTPRDGWPRGPYLFYECALCREALPSKPHRALICECGNLSVGAENVQVGDPMKVRLFEEKPDGSV